MLLQGSHKGCRIHFADSFTQQFRQPPDHLLCHRLSCQWIIAFRQFNREFVDLNFILICIIVPVDLHSTDIGTSLKLMIRPLSQTVLGLRGRTELTDPAARSSSFWNTLTVCAADVCCSCLCTRTFILLIEIFTMSSQNRLSRSLNQSLINSAANNPSSRSPVRVRKLLPSSATRLLVVLPRIRIPRVSMSANICSPGSDVMLYGSPSVVILITPNWSGAIDSRKGVNVIFSAAPFSVDCTVVMVLFSEAKVWLLKLSVAGVCVIERCPSVPTLESTRAAKAASSSGHCATMNASRAVLCCWVADAWLARRAVSCWNKSLSIA
jgi:hypothetical protein